MGAVGFDDILSILSTMKALVLTCDRYRVMTEHMILQYERLWPGHPFQFRIPWQELGGKDSPAREYVKSPAPIKATVLKLLEDLADDEWVYWCLDDKYPMRLAVDSIQALLPDIERMKDLDGLLFCRCRETLDKPELTLMPGVRSGPSGESYLERKTWWQIWIHQFVRVKVIRHLFRNLPDNIPNAKVMDDMKFDVAKLPEHRLFVTQNNYAVFGESTIDGIITQNCHDSIRKAGMALPDWFSRSNGRHVTMGVL
jgi:hypothetical protein